MDVTLPLWQLLAASAFGGAVVNGLVALLTRLLDRPLRHDDARREHYVAMMTALDELQQALVNAVNANNNRAFGDPPTGGFSAEQRAAVRNAAAHALARAKEVSEKFQAARRAEHTVSLFAPKAVVVPLNKIMDSMSGRVSEVWSVFTVKAEPLAVPTFPDADFTAFRDAIRRSLGVKQLRLNVVSSAVPAQEHPEPDESDA